MKHSMTLLWCMWIQQGFSSPQDHLLAARVPFGGNSRLLGQGGELGNPCWLHETFSRGSPGGLCTHGCGTSFSLYDHLRKIIRSSMEEERTTLHSFLSGLFLALSGATSIAGIRFWEQSLVGWGYNYTWISLNKTHLKELSLWKRRHPRFFLLQAGEAGN